MPVRPPRVYIKRYNTTQVRIEAPATSHKAKDGEVFFDPETHALRIGDGMTNGGVPVTRGIVNRYTSEIDGTEVDATVIDLNSDMVFLSGGVEIAASYFLGDGLYDGQTITFVPQSVNDSNMDVGNIRVYINSIYDQRSANGIYSTENPFPWYPFTVINTYPQNKSTAIWNASIGAWIIDPWSFD